MSWGFIAYECLSRMRDCMHTSVEQAVQIFTPSSCRTRSGFKKGGKGNSATCPESASHSAIRQQGVKRRGN